MKIISLQTLHCDAGWRVWTFIKIETDQGITGWSECTDSHGSPRAIQGAVEDFKPLLIGRDPRAVEKIYWELYSATRQSPGSVIQKAIAGIENALLDIKGKSLGVPVYELLGGAMRDKIRVYWSHCGTTRVRAPQHVGKPAITSLEGIAALGKEVMARGFTALKTNFILFDPAPGVYMPGFGKSKGGPELNLDRALLTSISGYIETWRRAVGERVDLMLDLNFNFKTEGYSAIARTLEPYGLTWLELDTYDPVALGDIKNRAPMPICSGENLYGLRDWRPYFERHAMDVASVDVSWNGAWQAKKIADMAEVYEMNVAPHNHHSHLGTLMSAHFAAAIPNLRMLEVDVDDVPWKDDLTSGIPQIEQGFMTLPSGPGWGVEIREDTLSRHPPKFL